MELTKTSAKLTETYRAINDAVLCKASVVWDSMKEQVTNLDGQVYALKDGKQGDYIGSFNGVLANGVMTYSTSQMPRQQHSKVMQVVEELEQSLINN